MRLYLSLSGIPYQVQQRSAIVPSNPNEVGREFCWVAASKIAIARSRSPQRNLQSSEQALHSHAAVCLNLTRPRPRPTTADRFSELDSIAPLQRDLPSLRALQLLRLQGSYGRGGREEVEMKVERDCRIESGQRVYMQVKIIWAER